MDERKRREEREIEGYWKEEEKSQTYEDASADCGVGEWGSGGVWV